MKLNPFVLPLTQNNDRSSLKMV